MIWRHVMLALLTIESVPGHVIDRVGRLVRGLQAELELFHPSYEPEVFREIAAGGAIEKLIASHIAERHRRLERVADTLRDQSLEVRSSVRVDYPIFEAVIRHALRQGSSLVILPVARADPSGKGSLSYTEARLIEVCPCPLLLLKTAQVYSQGPIIAAVDPRHVREKPAELDDAIVAAAETLSSALSDAPVRLYHAVQPTGEHITPEVVDDKVASRAQPTRQKEYFLESEHLVQELAMRHEIQRDRVQIEAGPVESSLPIYARQARADVVVMGAVSRSYPQAAFFGYTAERVLTALNCDVLIVKPKGFRCPVSRRPHRNAAERLRAGHRRS